MRVCCISDLHGELPKISECDLLVIAGDICPHFEHPVGGKGDVFGQSQWLYGPFTDWLNKIPARNVVAVWGNHDFIGEKAPHLVPKNLRWTLLQDSICEIEGIKIYGSPYQLWFWDWAFNAPDGPEGERFLANKFKDIPDDTDIFIVHGPPLGYGDMVPNGLRTGSKALLDRIFEVKPQLSVHGHIHCGYGQWQFDRGNKPEGIIVNASVLDEDYKLTQTPIVVEIYAQETKDDSNRDDLSAEEEAPQEA